MPPCEKIKYKCKNSHKKTYGISNFLTNLKPLSKEVIRSFDLSKADIVEVVYRKIELPDFSW